MKTFEKAFSEVLLIEGGISDHVSDKGGLTKYGISQKAFPNLNIRSLTISQAKEIYFENYWQTKRLNLDLFDEKIAIELFDTAVNMGVGIAGTFLQKALNLMNRNQKDFKDLTVDGNCGQNTMSAYYKVDKNILLKVLNGLQFCKYVDICENNSSQEVFFNGWMKRV